MTTPSTARKAGPLLGNGSTTSFPFTFKVFAASDIKVVTANSAGVETVRVLNTDYSVSLNANQETSPGGTVTYPISGAALPTGSVLSIIGNLSYDQPLDLPSGGNFSPLALENQLDRATMQIQQLKEMADRSAKLPTTYGPFDMESVTADVVRIADSANNIDTVAGSIANVNAVAGNASNINTVAGISSDVTAVAAVASDIPAVATLDAADLATVADNVTDITNFADVYQGGKAADPAIRNDGSSLQPGDLYFNTTTSRLRVFGGTVWQEGNAGSITVQRFSGTGAQTAFSLSTAPQAEENTQVYIGGVYQQKDQYSISGTTLTFSSAPPSGTDNVEVVVMSVLPLGTTDASLTNYLPAGTGAVATTVQTKLREIISVGDYGDTDGIGAITLNVPSQFATIQAAFTWLANKTIAAGSTVTIQVADGTHDYTGAAVVLNHPQGSQIRLIGNQTTPTNCVLTWTNTSTGIDALVVSNGNVLGYINGFHITRTAHAGTSISTGLLADNGSVIVCGPNMRVSNHYYGIAARMGSYIKADGAVVSGAGDVGIWAFVGSTVDCSSAAVTNTADPLQPLGFGIQAEYGSSVNCDSASASGNKVAGIAALSGSSVRCHNATANSNTGSGLLARDGATIEAHGATTNSNTRYGIEEITNGTVYYTTITQSGNTLGNRLPVVVLNSDSSLGARLSSTSGVLRVDSGDTSPIYFHTSGGLQMEVFNTASSSSWPQISGSSAGQPRILSGGAASNIDFNVQAKGTGAIFIGSHRTNFLRINGANTGSPTEIRAEGGDTNIDLLLAGKGTGVVRFGTWSSNADAPVNGFVTVKDAAGNTRKLATIA